MDEIIKRHKFHEEMIERCICLGEFASKNGDIPVGCIIIHGDQIVATAYNTRVHGNDPLGHAELNAIREACKKLGVNRLDDASIYVNLEPCTMRASAIQQCKISKIFFGAWDEKAGGCGGNYDIARDSRLGMRLQVYGGILEDRCVAQLTDFFGNLR